MPLRSIIPPALNDVFFFFTRTVLSSDQTTNSLNNEQHLEANGKLHRVLFCVFHFLTTSSEFNIFISNSNTLCAYKSVILFLVCFLFLWFFSFLSCSWFCICTIFIGLNWDKLWLMWQKICVSGVALVKLLNSFESGCAELAIDAHFIVIVTITARK